MRVAVFGSGAVGGYFGGRLAEAGFDVTFIARGDQLTALRTTGLRLSSPAGDCRLPAVQATDDPVTVGSVDLVLVGVKAWQVAAAAEAMRPLVGPGTMVLPLQNGVEAPDQLAAVLDRSAVLGGLCRVLSEVVEPGHIRHSGIAPTVVFGEPDNRRSERVQRLFQAFAGARGVTAVIPADIHVALWHKLLLIAPWSGVGAVTQAPAGVFRRLPGTRLMLTGAMHEVVAVAQARGVNLPVTAVAQALNLIDELPDTAIASMQRDIAAGRPSELEAQNGAVVRLGRMARIPTPIHAFLYHSLLPQEDQARDSAGTPATNAGGDQGPPD